MILEAMLLAYAVAGAMYTAYSIYKYYRNFWLPSSVGSKILFLMASFLLWPIDYRWESVP